METPRNKPKEKFAWLSHEEIVTMEVDALRATLNEIYANMTDRQYKLVVNMLEGKSDAESARLAGYSTTETNPGWRARKTRKVVFALAVGREIAMRESETSPGWIRSQLRFMLEKARDDDDRLTFLSCLRELCKIDGSYAVEQTKLLLAGHDGDALQKEVSDDEFELLSNLWHTIREDEEHATH